MSRVFIPCVYTSQGCNLERSDPASRLDFVRQHIAHGWSEADAERRYAQWACHLIEANPPFRADGYSGRYCRAVALRQRRAARWLDEKRKEEPVSEHRPAPALPPITTCEHCGTHAAEVVCHICKQPRRGFLAFIEAHLRGPLRKAA